MPWPIIIQLTSDEKRNLPRRHTSHPIGDRGIDKAHLVRLADGAQFLRHLRRDGTRLNNQLRSFSTLH